VSLAIVSLSFAMSAPLVGAAAVSGAAAVGGGAVTVGGAGTGAGGLGASCGDGVGAIHAPDIAHHNTNTNVAAAITLIKSRSMVALQSPPKAVLIECDPALPVCAKLITIEIFLTRRKDGARRLAGQ
jgi:hypothetical protein